MLFHQREFEQNHRPQPPVPELPGAPNSESIANQAVAALAATDEILNQALSGNSEKFLQASRQQGGQ